MITEKNKAEVYYEFVQIILELEQIECEVDRVAKDVKHFQTIADMLGVERVNIEIQNNVGTNLKTVEPYVLTNIYNRGNVDDTRYIRLVKQNGAENLVTYTIYQKKGDPDWQTEDIELIDAVFSLLYVYNARANLTRHARYMAFFDKDFDMPNIVAFAREVSTRLYQHRLEDCVTCRFNLKSFSAVNAQVGAPRGTIVMKLFLKGLQDIVKEEGTVYRIGGDNFLMLFHKKYFEEVKDYLKETIIKTGFEDISEIAISASVGFFLDAASYDDPEDIIFRTHQIGMTAKEEKYKNCLIFDDEFNERMNRKAMIVRRFPEAIKNKEFQVYYQPKYNSITGQVVGAEALCRWIREDEIISPAQFIPMLEQSILICQLDFYMLDCVCSDIRKWLDEGKKPVRISVNFSRVHLKNKHLAERIKRIIEKYDIPHELVEIELTETTTDVDFEELKQVVIDLNNQGVNTSVDDFGVGYSSLNLIRELPWKVLKIDRSFLPLVEEADYTQKVVILKHIITMANELGVECLAEGAETKEQVELLKQYGCNTVQGFYFCKPIPKAEFEKKM